MAFESTTGTQIKRRIVTTTAAGVQMKNIT